MRITRPACFDRFHCIAAACPDSCCQEWEVAVDEQTAERYRSLPGPLGDRLREVLRDEDGEIYFTIADRRCPMWRQDGLCRIQAELGADALCRTCREFPRLRHDYGDFVELQLELSCPEAARYIVAGEAVDLLTEDVPGGGEGDYDQEAMEILLATRRTMRSILASQDHSVPEILAMALLYGCQAQSELDSGEIAPFHGDSALEEAAGLARPGDPGAMVEFFQGLELLTERWKDRLAHPEPGPWRREHLFLARYFVDRYWLQAVADYDLYSRVKFMVLSCLLIRWLGGDPAATAQLYSREIENDAQNVDAILDAAYTCAAFTDDKVLGMLLCGG